MSTHDTDHQTAIADGALGIVSVPQTTPPADTADQFARLFGHARPKRKRRKTTLRDGNSGVSKARGGVR